MEKLLKEYELNSDMQYFGMIVESVVNGQRKQAIRQFDAMHRKNRKRFITAIYGNWQCGLSASDKEMFLNQL